jgi:hypothetical protein
MMSYFPYLFDILKYTISGLVILAAAFYVIKPYLDRTEQIQLLEYRKSISQQTLPLRLQGYERVILFIERVNPASMLIRLNGGSYTARELHSIAVSEIRDEYQHNITQQVYVTSRAWGVVRRVKDDTISIMTNAVKELPENASGLDLSRMVLNHLATMEENPYDIATGLIRKDIDELF